MLKNKKCHTPYSNPIARLLPVNGGFLTVADPDFLANLDVTPGVVTKVKGKTTLRIPLNEDYTLGQQFTLPKGQYKVQCECFSYITQKTYKITRTIKVTSGSVTVMNPAYILKQYKSDQLAMKAKKKYYEQMMSLAEGNHPNAFLLYPEGEGTFDVNLMFIPID